MRSPMEKAAGPNLTLLRCPPQASNRARNCAMIVLDMARREAIKAYPKRSPEEWTLMEPNAQYHWRGPSGPMFHLMTVEEIKDWEFKNLELGGPEGLPGPPVRGGLPVPPHVQSQKAPPPPLLSSSSSDSDDTVIVHIAGERAEPRQSLREGPSYSYEETREAESEHVILKAAVLSESCDGGTGSSQASPPSKVSDCCRSAG